MKHLDLDLIKPEVAKVTVGGKDYEVKPPTVADVIDLQRQGDKMQTGEVGIEGLQDVMNKLIPGLKIATLEIGQVQALVGFITEFFTGDEEVKKKTVKTA